MPRHAPYSWRYTACGLTIAADAPLAGLVPADGAVPDLQVALHAGEPVPLPDSADDCWYRSPHLDAAGEPLLVAEARAHDGSRWLRYSEGALFRVDGAAGRVDAWWQAPLTAADAATYLLGPVLAFVMRLRGLVPLHASAVAIDGRAVLFAGDPGAGKSTTAAAFAALGFPVLSDDVVPVIPADAGPVASPGYPRLSLWADAAEAMFGTGEALPAYSETYTKRYLDLDAPLSFQRTPLPVGAVFVLAAGPGPERRPLSSRDALVALLRHTYGTYLIDMGMRAREFDVLARLVDAVPVCEVRFTAGLGSLAAQCAAIAAELQPPVREGANASAI